MKTKKAKPNKTGPRYRVNTKTDEPWDEVCDTNFPHVNGVGVQLARALPTDAKRICRLLNQEHQVIALLMYAVDGVLDGCGNSYANACVSSWLELAKKVGGYKGRTVGSIRELKEEWEAWIDEHMPDGMLPDWKVARPAKALRPVNP